MKTKFFSFRLGAPVIGVLACVSAILVSYCGKKEDEKVEAKFSAVYSSALAGCAKCHTPGNAVYTQVTNLDLSSQAAAYTSLTSAAAIAVKPECTGKYVVAGNSAGSILWAVLDNTTREAFPAANGGCSVLPEATHGYGEVSAASRAAVKAWIDAGAPNN